MGEQHGTGATRDINSMQDADADALAGYYDDWSASYDTDLADLGYEAPARAVRLLAAHGVSPSGRILDACCGTGLVGAALNHAGYRRLSGFDVSQRSLAVARQSGLYGDLIRQDMNETLAYPDSVFDAVMCIGSLTYATDRDRLFREFARVLRPGGIAVFTFRDDLWDAAFDRIHAGLEEAGVLRTRLKSDPQPYLPLHPDFADRIRIRYGVFAAC